MIAIENEYFVSLKWVSIGYITREQGDHYINRCGDPVFPMPNTECTSTFAYHTLKLSLKPEFGYVDCLLVRVVKNRRFTIFYSLQICLLFYSNVPVYNNIFNLLITVNAASNFILYCLLSDKYRKTVKQLFCGVRAIRRNTLSSSRFTSGRTTTSSFYSRPRNTNFFNMPTYKQRGPRFSISKEEYANLQVETSKRNRFSITTLTSQSRNNSIVSHYIL